MWIGWDTIITAGAVLSALVAIITLILKVHKWYLETQELKTEILKVKEEDTLICFALSACLDGLMQLGANHTVPVAKDKLDKFLNKRAHK